MANPTAPVDITVTLDQRQVDYLWDIIETEFPGVTGQQAMTKLEEWAFEGMKDKLVSVLRKRQRSATAISRNTLATEFDPA